MFIAALCCMVPAQAQKSFGPLKYSHMCSYYGEEITGDITTFKSGPTAEKVISKMMAVIGLKPNFELRAADVPNAAAVMLNGKRFILYNPDFMDKINASTGTNWAAISILAHEIGHHLNGHTLDNVGSRPQTELDADEFSGFVLHKMGASLPDAQAVMALISSPDGSKTHPPKRDRLSFIANGWGNAGDVGKTVMAPATTVASQRTVAVATPAVSRTATAQKPVVTPKPAPRVQPQQQTHTVATRDAPAANNSLQRSITANVRSDVYFTEDPHGQYYLTTKGNLVQVENSKVYLIGKLYKSDRNGYTMMFSDPDTDKKIYVANGGALINSSNQKIGYMKSR
jgi:hypothetical protein